MHYLDNAATTAVDSEVISTISSVLEHCFANPSSLYTPGYEAECQLDESRRIIANALGVTGALTPAQPTVLFTASGSESNNIAILGAARARKNWGNHLVATGYEHPSVTKVLQLLEQQEGFSLTFIPPEKDGTVSPEKIVDAVGPKTVLVCAMHMNNETGAVLDVASLAKQVKEKNSRTAFHVDGVQAFTKIPLALPATLIDTYAVSGHKIHAPKGVGALYLRKGFHILPVLAGGGQESGLRPGTENIPYIAGFAKAVELAKKHHVKTATTLHQLHSQLLEGLAALPDVVVHSPANAWPGIVNLAVPGLKSETLLHHLEVSGVYVSSGSACSKGEASHTLTAMGLPPASIEGALRVSFSRYNTPADVSAFLDALASGVASLSRGRLGQQSR